MVGCCLFFCTMISKPAPDPLLSFSFLFKAWSLSFYSSRDLPSCLEWTSVIYIYGRGGLEVGVGKRGGLAVVLTCRHRSYCTVSLFNKDVKSVCRASFDMINRLHDITKLSKIPCRDHTPSHYRMCFYFDYYTPASHASILKDTDIITSIKTLLMLLYYM